MGRPTQRDVADLAGVSRATVSYVVNKRSGGKVHITEETRQRVLDAINQLGYQPNVMARSLRTQQTQLLAVMVSDLTNPFYPRLIRGAQNVAEKHDYQILIYDCNDDPTRERTFVDTMLRWRVDGVVMMPFHLTTADLARLREGDIQVAVLGSTPTVAGVDHVQIEEHNAVAELIGYLFSKGHRRIAHLAGRQDTPPGRTRLKAYQDALAQLNIPYDEALVRYGEFHQEGVEDLVLSLFPNPTQENHPTALFAANDIMAIEAITTLTSHGWRVPEDVAVCGYDNIPRAEIVVPSLTTVDPSPQLRGQRATELLLERLQNENPSIESRFVTVPAHLIIRNSV